jgi:hypothetical protein
VVRIRVAALVLAGTIYAVRTFDPLAFAPRTVEACEHGGETGGTSEAGHAVEADEDGGDDNG